MRAVSNAVPRDAVPHQQEEHERRFAVLALILGASIVSTALHFTHNFIEVAHYPHSSLLPVSNDTTRLIIAVSWPTLTSMGVLALWFYRRGKHRAAYVLLVVYSFTGISTLGHFLDGSPHIAPFWYGTIFTDALAGFAVLAFVYWSAVVSAARHGHAISP